MSLETILIVVSVLFLPGGGGTGDGVTSTSVRLVAFVRHDFLKVKQASKTSKSEPTEDQQKNNRPDLEMTRENRRSLMKDKPLSTYAHNVSDRGNRQGYPEGPSSVRRRKGCSC